MHAWEVFKQRGQEPERGVHRTLYSFSAFPGWRKGSSVCGGRICAHTRACVRNNFRVSSLTSRGIWDPYTSKLLPSEGQQERRETRDRQVEVCKAAKVCPPLLLRMWVLPQPSPRQVLLLHGYKAPSSFLSPFLPLGDPAGTPQDFSLASSKSGRAKRGVLVLLKSAPYWDQMFHHR